MPSAKTRERAAYGGGTRFRSCCVFVRAHPYKMFFSDSFVTSCQDEDRECEGNRQQRPRRICPLVDIASRSRAQRSEMGVNHLP
jgi:hypothetical protein